MNGSRRPSRGLSEIEESDDPDAAEAPYIEIVDNAIDADEHDALGGDLPVAVDEPSRRSADNRILMWARSPEGQRFAGRWVVLTENGEVLAAADTPGLLVEEAQRSRERSTLLYVMPIGIVVA